MRIFGHADWSGATNAIAEVERILGRPDRSAVVGEAPFAALTAIGTGVDDVSDAVGRIEHVALVADARIDNLVDLRARLRCDPAESTAQVLSRAYLEWGPGFADRLVGDFAMVLWDARRRSLVAARDPFGVRPLAFRISGRRCWFASEPTRLLETSPRPVLLDDQMLAEHLMCRSKSEEATFFRDVRQVRAGHALEVTADVARSERYWFPPAPRSELENSTPEELFEEIRRRFTVAVERRLRSKRPVVIHVSGGLDSSSIAMAADRLLQGGADVPRTLVGASQVYPGLSCDETPYIEAVERAIHYPIERWDGRQSDPVDLIDPALEGPGRRTTTTSGHDGDVAIAQRIGAGVILSGIGGDDLMIAEGFIRDLVSRHEWRAAARATFLVAGLTVGDRARRIKRVAGHFLPPRLRQARARLSADVPDWIAPRLREIAREVVVEDEADVSPGSYVQRRAWGRLTGAHIRRAISVRESKATPLGFEYRYPYLDRALVELVLNLPAKCLPGPVHNARIHRVAFAPLLPAKIAARHDKAEMTPALENRIRVARPLIDDLLLGRTWASGESVDQGMARRFWRGITGVAGESSAKSLWRIWAVATLEVWTRRHLGYHPAN